MALNLYPTIFFLLCQHSISLVLCNVASYKVEHQQVFVH